MEKQNCEHKVWRRTGEWDGVKQADGSRTGGPMVECAVCGLKKNATYEEWAKIERESDFDYKRANNKFNKK